MAKPLVFIDTNIYLDFYRLRSREAGLSILAKIEANRESLIVTHQLSMEFKKNRQKVILETHKTLKAPDFGSLSVPPILSETKSWKSLDAHKNGIRKQAEKLRLRLENIVTKPSTYDPVYKALQRVFKHPGPYNLTESHEATPVMLDKARQRHMLGCPPRKPNDTSMGDALNWEWILATTKESGLGVVIVTRDSDFGETVTGTPTLNDWLREEFRTRVSKKRSIILTDRIAEAFKAAEIKITKKEERAEKELLPKPPESADTQIIDLMEALKRSLRREPIEGHNP